MIRRSLVPSLLAVGLLVLGACNADRAGTLGGNVSVSLNSCSGSAGSTEVVWSGINTASVRVTYRKGSTNTKSSWTSAAAAATDGTVSVAIPATAASGAWSVVTVELATAANGGGTKTSKAIDCATAVTTTTAPVLVSDPPVTLPPVTIETIVEKPTTTAPTCSTLPINSVAPTIYRPGDGYVHVDEGTWDAGPNCSFTGWAHAWERSWYNGPWESFSGLQDWEEPISCGFRYRVTVTKSNQLGNTSATSAVVPGC